MMKIWFNGDIVDECGSLSVFDRGFTLGDGVFETAYNGDNGVEYFELHMMRLTSTMADLGMSMSYGNDAIYTAIKEILLANNLLKGAVRITASRGTGSRGLVVPDVQNISVVISVLPVRRLRPPAKMGITKFTRNDTSPLSSYKMISYGNEIMALNTVRRIGFDEAVMLNTQGNVCCVTSSNIFFIKDGEIFTPSLNQGCLSGIMRSIIINKAQKLGFRVNQAVVSIDDVKSADAVFLTNSITRIRTVAVFGEVYYDLQNSMVNQLIKNIK